MNRRKEFRCLGFLNLEPGAENMFSRTGPEQNLQTIEKEREDEEVRRILKNLCGSSPEKELETPPELRKIFNKYKD